MSLHIFLILIFNELFTFKTSNETTLKDRELYSGLERHQSLVYAVIQIPLFSLQCSRDFQIRKLVCNVI